MGLRNIFSILLIVLVLTLFIKPSHVHISKTCAHQNQETQVNNQHDNHDSARGTDCEGDCSCPQHRINGCSPLTAIAKSTRIDFLSIAGSLEIEKQFIAKQSPFLDGPFRPPLS